MPVKWPILEQARLVFVQCQSRWIESYNRFTVLSLKLLFTGMCDSQRFNVNVDLLWTYFYWFLISFAVINFSYVTSCWIFWQHVIVVIPQIFALLAGEGLLVLCGGWCTPPEKYFLIRAWLLCNLLPSLVYYYYKCPHSSLYVLRYVDRQGLHINCAHGPPQG